MRIRRLPWVFLYRPFNWIESFSAQNRTAASKILHILAPPCPVSGTFSLYIDMGLEELQARETGHSGDQKAEYPAALHKYLLRRLRHRQDAQDLAQEAYLRFLQLPSAAAVRNSAAYLFRIAFNLITERQLRQDRSVVSCDSELLEQHADVP